MDNRQVACNTYADPLTQPPDKLKRPRTCNWMPSIEESHIVPKDTSPPTGNSYPRTFAVTHPHTTVGNHPSTRPSPGATLINSAPVQVTVPPGKVPRFLLTGLLRRFFNLVFEARQWLLWDIPQPSRNEEAYTLCLGRLQQATIQETGAPYMRPKLPCGLHHTNTLGNTGARTRRPHQQIHPRWMASVPTGTRGTNSMGTHQGMHMTTHQHTICDLAGSHSVPPNRHVQILSSI